MADAAEDERLPPSRCHESHPVGRRLPSLAVQVGELADVVDFHVLRGAARLALICQKPLKQLGTSLTPAGKKGVLDVCPETRSEWYPAEAGNQRFFAHSRNSGLQTRPGSEGVVSFAANRAPSSRPMICACAPTFSVAEVFMTQWSEFNQAMLSAS